MTSPGGDLILVGDSAFAEVAHEYFMAFSPWRVRAFAVERAHLKRDTHWACRSSRSRPLPRPIRLRRITSTSPLSTHS
jgi:hypothetical protein